jgi:hypothetical protein
MLTEQQVRHFHEEGYLFLPDTFTAEECAFLRDEAVEIYRHDRPEVWREKSGAPRTAFAAHLYNEAFGCSAPSAHDRTGRAGVRRAGLHAPVQDQRQSGLHRRRLAMASGLRHLGSRRRDAGAAGDEHRGVSG